MSNNEKYTIMSLPVFEKLAYEEMEVLGNIVSSCQFHAGQVIFQEGTNGSSMYFVVEGTLEVIKQSEDGKPAVITNLVSGQSVGEMSLIEGIVRSATVQAKTDGTLLLLKREDLEKLLDEHPKIGIKVLKGISQLLGMNLRKMSAEMTKLMMSIV